MAGGPVGNMTIKVDLDGTGFNKGIAGLNRQMKMVSAEMASNLSVFNKTDKSVEKLKTTYDGLTKKQQIQEEKVKRLKDNYQELSKETGENSAKTQAAAAEYNKANAELNSMNIELDDLNKQIKQMESPWTKIGKGMEEFGGKVQKIGNNMKDIGKKASTYITAPVVGAFTLGTKAAIDWESALAGVNKTLADGDNLDVIAEGIREMALELPVAATEIASVTEMAQQLGVSGEKDVLTFTKAIIDMGESTNMSREQAAEQMARFANIMGMPIGKVNELGSSIVALGNNFATSESDIMNMSMRLAGMGKLTGMTEADVMALSATMSSLGIEAESGGTAMTQVMNKMSNAVAAGGTDLEIFASAAGVSSEEFAKAFNDRPIEALGMLIKSLEESGMSAGEMNGALETLGIKGIREADAIKRLVGSSDMLTEATNLSSDAFKEGNALKDEATVRYETMASKIEMLKNRFKEMGIQLGEILMPYVEKAVDFLGKMTEKFTGLSDETKKMIVVIASIAASFGPLFVVLGTAVMWFGGLMKAIGPLMPIIGKMGAIFGALTGPVGITVGIIAALTGAFILAYKKSETFRNMIDGIVDKFKIAMDWASQFKDGVNAVIDMFKGDWLGGRDMLQRLGLTPEQILAIENFVISVQMIIHNFKETFKKVFGEISAFFKGIFEDFKVWWDSDGALIISAIGTIFSDTFTVIKDVVKIGFDVVMNIFNTVLPIIKGLWDTFWPLIEMTVVNTWNSIKLFIGIAMDLIRGIISAVSAMIQGDWSRVWEIVKETAISIWNRIKGFITDSINNIKNTVGQKVQELKDNFVNKLQEMWNGTKDKFSGMYTTAKNKVIDMKNSVVEYITNMKDDAMKKFDDLVEGAKALPGKMKDGLIAGKDKVVEGIKSLGNSMAETLGDVVNGVIGGINTVMSKIGIDKSISEWTVPEFSRGTGQGSPSGRLTRNGKIAMDTLAVVGDKGPGNGKGTRELVHYPNGQVGLYDNDATIFAPKGTTIFNNKQTEELLGQLPKFSKGTGFWGNIKNIASKAFDYITNPSKIFNAIVDNYMQAWNVGAFAKDLGKGAWKNMKSGLLEWVKARFSEAGTGKKQKWMDRYPITTPYSPFSAVPGYPRAFNGGRHYGIDWGTPVGVNLTSPVAGTVSRQSDHGGGNVARVDYGKGAMYFLHMNSVKPGKVGIGESLGYSGNTGAFTTGPHVHVQDENPKTSFLQNRNTRNPLKMFKSHFNGGLIKTAGLFNLHPNEYVVPMDNPTNAMKLIALMSKELAGKSKQTNQLPNLMPRDNNRVEEKLDVMIELLQSLLMKDTDVYMDGEKLSKDVDRRNSQREKRYDRFKGGVYI